MTSATCAVLTAAFPLLLIFSVLDTRGIRPLYRRGALYQWSLSAGVVANIWGLVATVWGVENSGISDFWAVMAWGAFIVAVAGATVLFLLLISTFDRDDKNRRQVFGRFFHWLAKVPAP